MCNKSEYYFEIYLISLVCSTISALSIIFFFILCYKAKLEGPSIMILKNMSIIDLIRSFVFLFPYSYSSNFYFCQVFATVVNGALFSNCIWSVFIVITLNQQYSNFPEPPNKSFMIWNIFAFILVPIYQILPILTNSYGFNDGFCTYKEDSLGYIWRFIQEGLILIICVAGVVMNIKLYQKYVGYHFFNFSEYFFEKGMVYSIIYLIITATVLVFRFTEIYVNSCRIKELAVISYSFVALHGFFNVLALFLNRNFREAIRCLFRTHEPQEVLGSFFEGIL